MYNRMEMLFLVQIQKHWIKATVFSLKHNAKNSVTMVLNLVPLKYAKHSRLFTIIMVKDCVTNSLLNHQRNFVESLQKEIQKLRWSWKARSAMTKLIYKIMLLLLNASLRLVKLPVHRVTNVKEAQATSYGLQEELQETHAPAVPPHQLTTIPNKLTWIWVASSRPVILDQIASLSSTSEVYSKPLSRPQNRGV